ncbi:hypothetical protein QFZ53_002481 [Microbacterium natoriense]|uniref:Uncharacterized protein n=1 Tax=Microbacterium natoriense TaxID=284570 RepID=A0AAW8EXS7_9MICO|nr:hypothetical protein [Microbacterium natoriense]MDQ0648285.1 hypothetical protein [Microbacterium natoriense]
MTELIYIDSPGLSFRETGADFRWIDSRRFSVSSSSGHRSSDFELLAALVADDWYDHSFAEPAIASPAPGGLIHGPYWLEAISAETFVDIERSEAVRKIEAWASAYGGVPAAFLTRVRTMIDELLPSAWTIYELPDIRSVAQHDWGDAIGTTGFLEFVGVSPDRTKLNLFVASDD